MSRFYKLIAVLLPALFVAADPAFAQPLQQLRGHVPNLVIGLTPVRPLADSTPIDLIIGLPLRNRESLTAALRDIYEPTSPRFHQYLTPEQYTELYSPTAADFQTLLNFARVNNLTVVTSPPNRRFLHVRAPAAVINEVFHVKLQQYKHPTEDRHFYAPATEPTVALDTPISYLTGLDNLHLPGRFSNSLFQKIHPPGSPVLAGGSGPNGLYSGKDFRAAYAQRVSLTGRAQVVGILQLNGYTQSDIRAYEQQFGLPDVPLQNVYLDNYTGTDANIESAADIELVISMAPGISKAVIYGAPYGNPGVHDLLNEMANPTKGEPLPSQITTSYYFYYDPNVYASLAQLAIQGQALFVASGDKGSYDEFTGSGDFPPADHPLVTSVGGTELQTSGPGGAWISETAAKFSGGGYSPWWPPDPQFVLPSYQTGIDFTLSQGSTSARNAPDVAIVADKIEVYFNGGWTGFAGTSAAAPLWAGFWALVNEQAAASGRPRVGFANPALYEIGKGGNCPPSFHDIVTGNNFNSTNPSKYSAVKGFDLVTGWGSPNGSHLILALQSMPRSCDLGAQCGTQDDGCGGTVQCGTCSSGSVCNDVNRCVSGCAALCQQQYLSCLECDRSQPGGCIPPFKCADGRTGCLAACNCKPKTCAELGLQCGPATDGCGQTLDCGGCGAGLTCSGGQCVCVPRTACDGACGPIPDGCGGTLDCGRCGCTPSCSGKRCGAGDGCGHTCVGFCPKVGYVCEESDDGRNICVRAP